MLTCFLNARKEKAMADNFGMGYWEIVGLMYNWSQDRAVYHQFQNFLYTICPPNP